MLGICCISVHLHARQVGVYRSDAYIQSELGGAIVSKHFKVFFPVHWPNQKVKTLVADLEFYHAELAQFFGRAPEVPIRVFYYKNRHQKKRLMGARKTRIAKPWQWAFHIDNPRIALSTVKHEMAHIFAAQYGKAPHRLSLGQNFLPNMGIIEGVAEAATWPHRRLNLHESSAAMKQLGFAPDIRFVFAPEKFYGVNGSTAYTLCGSFLRFLYDKHGAQMLWQVYRQGHLEGIDGLNLDALMTDWEGHLNGISLPEPALAEARLRYDRPSIFGRACAREIASLWRTYRHALQSNRASHAEATLGEILGHLPSNPNARLAEIDLMIRNGRLKDALPRARQLSRDHTAGGVIRSYASERYLDALVMTGGDADADITYDSLAAETFQRPRLRNLGIKSAALKRPGVKAEIVRYLSARLDRAQRLEALNSIELESGPWPELDYLKARVLLNGSENHLSLTLFERAYRGLSAPALRYETLRLLARQLFDKRCYRKSAIAYQRLSNRVDLEILPSEKANHQEWSRRSTFFAAIQDQVQDLCPIKIDISIFGDEDAPDH